MGNSARSRPDLLLVPDAPVGANVPIDYGRVRDSLERLAHGIVRVVLSTHESAPSPPILVSGDWGSGKTSLLRLVRQRVENEGVPTVWFEAWRYEGQAPLLPALVHEIWRATPNKERGVLVALLSTSFRVAAPLITGSLGGLPLAGLATKAVEELADPKKRQAWINAWLGGSDDAPVHPLDTLREQINKLLEVWKGQIPVIFIDDLDRCTPEGAVSLLDALRALIVDSDARDARQRLACRFVVALDRDILAAAVSKKFAGVSGYDGNRYLEKVFPHSFHISTPDASEAAALLRGFLDYVERPLSKEDRQATEGLESALQMPVFANPRLMIRCMNRFIVAQSVATAYVAADAPPRTTPSAQAAADQESMDGTRPKAPLTDFRWSEFDHTRTLATWIAATERWPLLRRLMQQRNELFWESLARADELFSAPPQGATEMPNRSQDPDIVALYKEQGVLEWIKAELAPSGRRQLLRQADNLLRECGL